ncbi:MAG TPA: hypothetical protein VMG12_42025 [Polyangiaceae bacterium]|nr:hypothetical protein [Polyangiaceae bacterium]
MDPRNGASPGDGVPQSTRRYERGQNARARTLSGLSLCGLSLSVALGVAVPLGCNATDDTRVYGGVAPAAAPEPEATGSLLLALVTPDAVKYRLRQAVFDVDRSGVVLLSLDSEVDPDAESLEADLNPGQYRIQLRDGWALEQLADDGSATPVRAALVSANPASFGVRNDRVTTVAFSFTTSFGIITFGEGSLDVRLGVVDPASLGSCDVASQSGCPSGQHCLFADETGKTFCATPGELEVGAPCSSEQCVFGAQCLSLDPSAPEATSCTQLCNPLGAPFGCDCRGLSFGDDVGVCGPPPAGACDLLDPASCGDGLTCQYPGGSFGVCGTPGTGTEGSSCFGEECAAGLDCYGDDPEFGFAGTCYRFCDTQAPDCDFCFDVGTGSIGRCFF